MQGDMFWQKNFDIPHPSKSGHRQRYVCTETPEAGVYIRGKSRSGVIELQITGKILFMRTV